MKKHGSGGKGGKLQGRVEKRGGRKATPYDRGGGGRNTLAGKAGDAVSREMGGDLRSRMGGKAAAPKAEVGRPRPALTLTPTLTRARTLTPTPTLTRWATTCVPASPPAGRSLVRAPRRARSTDTVEP